MGAMLERSEDLTGMVMSLGGREGGRPRILGGRERGLSVGKVNGVATAKIFCGQKLQDAL